MTRRACLITCALLLMTFAWSTITFALTLNFASVDGATILFNGTGNFTFSHTGTYDFVINNETDGSTAIGLMGNIGGTFTIGAITTVFSAEEVTYQRAGVTSVGGTFSINDGTGKTLTGTLAWPNIDALKYQFPTIPPSSSSLGDLYSAIGLANLTSIQYEGSNGDLMTLKNNGPASAIVTFQFIPGLSLTQLKTGDPHSTSISGSINVIPIPASALLLGTGLVGLVGLRYRRKRQG